jgi:hypothetical protein
MAAWPGSDFDRGFNLLAHTPGFGRRAAHRRRSRGLSDALRPFTRPFARGAVGGRNGETGLEEGREVMAEADHGWAEIVALAATPPLVAPGFMS